MTPVTRLLEAFNRCGVVVARQRPAPLVKDRLPEALDRLVELYNAMNKPDEVKKYRELRATYPTPPEIAPMPKEKK